MSSKMNIYYDEEGDYLEIFKEDNSSAYGEDIGDDITLFKDKKTEEIVGVGILNFRKRTKSLEEIRLKVPFEINFSAIKTPVSH